MIPSDIPFHVFVGPTKSGTTWIHRYLESRGDVAMPENNKETFFFDKVYKRGLDWYEDLFPGERDRRPRAEVAPSYFHKPDAQRRIALHFRQAHIIVMVRDPADRAVSHYFHYRKRGEAACSLPEMSERHFDVVEAGMYNRHSLAWEELFGTSKVSYLEYDLLRRDPEAFCMRLCEVMDIPYVPVSEALGDRAVNAASLPRSLLAARAAQGATTFLRRRGLHRVVKSLKRLPFKKWLFAGGDALAAERSRIRGETDRLSSALFKDWEAFRGRVPSEQTLEAGHERVNAKTMIDQTKPVAT